MINRLACDIKIIVNGKVDQGQLDAVYTAKKIYTLDHPMVNVQPTQKVVDIKIFSNYIIYDSFIRLG